MLKLLGVNGEAWRGSALHWTDPNVLSLLPSLHLGYIRIPGGTTSSYWDWRTGQFSASGNQHQNIIKGNPNPGLPLSAWLAAVHAANTQPLYLLNLTTKQDGDFVKNSTDVKYQVDNQLALLDYASSQGFPVNYVELGNECYLHGDPASAAAFPTPQAYVFSATQFIEAIRQQYPTARIGACSLADIYKNISSMWRSTIETELAPIVDAFTYHHYSPIPFSPTNTNIDTLITAILADYEQAMRTTLQTIPNGKSAWLTEWNYSDASPLAPSMANTPAHGLVMAALAFKHLSEPNVELTGPHAALGTQGLYPAILATPTGPQLSAYGQALAGVGVIAQQLSHA